MKEVICSRSGLRFETENGRLKVHPQISYYTTHKNYDIRYPAIAVIERGKKEGWTTIERFLEEIEKALNPEPKPRPEYDFEGAYACRIVGAHPRCRFEREFLDPVDKEGRFKRYNLHAEPDGIYETVYKSAKGNATKHYYRFEAGALTELALSEVEELFPAIDPSATPDRGGCVLVEAWMGALGSIVQYDFDGAQGRSPNPQLWKVVEVKTLSGWEDEDGITGSGFYRGNAAIVSEWHEHKSYLRLATLAEIEQQERLDVEKEAAQNRTAEIKALWERVKGDAAAIYPQQADYPQGLSPVVQRGYFQDNRILVLEPSTLTQPARIWSLLYNGRDGDEWSHNNVISQYIGCYLELTPEQEAEIRPLFQIQPNQPDR